MNLPPAGAAAVVADLLRLLANTRSVLGTAGKPWQGQRDAYLGWVEDAERRLRGSSDDEPTEALHTERYWKIRELTAASVRPAGMVHAEIDAQHARLSSIAAGLLAPSTGPGGGAAPGVRAVLNTNVHLHFPASTSMTGPGNSADRSWSSCRWWFWRNSIGTRTRASPSSVTGRCG